MYKFEDVNYKLDKGLLEITKIDSNLTEVADGYELVDFVKAIYDSAKGLNLKKILITVNEGNLHILLTATNTSEVSAFNFKNVFPYVQFQLKDCKMVNARHNNGGFNDYLQATFYLQGPLSFIKTWKDYE
ncbi:hypothetical protein ACE193_15270 [Bernardetia sp. OM2101]|uniref:hypothetical protein n=1 Tax=Bernardetia sp. OM2101 TaxID=3344876 RepID=UPI0035CFC2A4